MSKRDSKNGSGKPRAGSKVIHVAFGPGGGRLGASDAGGTGAQPRRGAATALAERIAHQEPVTDVFTRTEIAKLLGVSASRLRSLDRAGIVSPSGQRRGKRAYTFSDLIQLRAAQSLLEKRVRMRDVGHAIVALRKTLPVVVRPLSELRISSDGEQIRVHTDDGDFEPLSGQMLLDFDTKDLHDDVVRVLRPASARHRSRTAYELYLRASELDEDPSTMGEAEQLYREAVELDPWLTIAYTNLGNICFRRQDTAAAEQLYRQALAIDQEQPEAQYNLGYVMLERGRAQEAIPLFLGAIKADPQFADAHFNLAMAYEQIGNSKDARPYWNSYIRLEPTGTWTEIAKRHL